MPTTGPHRALAGSFENVAWETGGLFGLQVCQEHRKAAVMQQWRIGLALLVRALKPGAEPLGFPEQRIFGELVHVLDIAVHGLGPDFDRLDPPVAHDAQRFGKVHRYRLQRGHEICDRNLRSADHEEVRKPVHGD